MSFVPFTDADFDAYQERKWRSNVFNRERLEVKQKLQALGRLLAPGLLARNGAPLKCEVSEEHPALWNQKLVREQHLFFSRNDEARRDLQAIISRRRTIASLIEDPSPLRHHILLSVTIDQAQLEIALKLHADASVDYENLVRKVQDFFVREKLLGLVRGLPPTVRVGIVGQEELSPGALDDAGLQALVAGLPAAQSWLSFREVIPRDLPLARSEAFAEHARETLGHLLPLLHFISWEKSNDHLAIRETIKQQQIQRQAMGLRPDDGIRVVRGVFAGKDGVVEEVDAKGRLRVRIGGLLVKLKSNEVERR